MKYKPEELVVVTKEHYNDLINRANCSFPSSYPLNQFREEAYFSGFRRGCALTANEKVPFDSEGIITFLSKEIEL